MRLAACREKRLWLVPVNTSGMIGIDRTIRLGERSRGISIVNFVTLKNDSLSFWGSANLHVYGNSYAVSRFCPSVCDEQAYQDRFRRILRRILR